MVTNNTTHSLNIKACLRFSKQPKKNTQETNLRFNELSSVSISNRSPPPQNKKKRKLFAATHEELKFFILSPKRWMGKTICCFPLSHCVHHLYSIELYFSVIKEEWIERNIEVKVHLREEKECF